MGRAGQGLRDGTPDLLEFIHEGLLGVHPPRRINEEHIGLAGHGGRDGIIRHGGRVGAMRPHHDIQFQPVRP